jgi:hypothetical protein
MSAMRQSRRPHRVVILASSLLLTAPMFAMRGLADEPSGGLFSRLFRGGSAASRGNVSLPPSPSAPAIVDSSPARPPATSAGPVSATEPRIIPQPRTSRPATDADPIVTRVALGRSDDGTQFGMFLQVYADGTVIDSEGVHRIGREDLRALTEAASQADLFRPRGHCGGASTDFMQQAYVVVYERSLGRLRANAFSYSGNTQGCDKAVQRLNAALEAVLAKIARPAPTSTAATAAPAPAPPSPGATSAPPTLLNGPATVPSNGSPAWPATPKPR